MTKQIVYYIFASEFGFTQEDVDKMDARDVEIQMLFINKIKEHQAAEMKK